jgi:hypothetical protein
MGMFHRMTVGFGLLILTTAVQAQQSTPPFPPDQNYYLEASVDNLTPYVGEQVIYTLRLYDIDSPPGSVQNLPDFDGFWIGESETREPRAEIINGRQYIVKEQEIVLYPAIGGNLTILPATYTMPARNGQILQTEPITLQVQGLPTGAPNGFYGAVGQFVEVESSVDRLTANLGDPVTLNVRIVGTGNLDRLSPPLMELPDTWRNYENQPTISYSQNGLRIGEKVFSWSLISDQPGTQTVPAFTFVYFDPQTGTYRTLTTEPISLEILPGENTTVPTNPTQPASVPDNLLSLKPVPKTLHTATIYPQASFWLLWLIPPLITGVGWVWSRQRQSQQSVQPKVRQSRALQQARSQLNTARKTQDSEVYAQIINTIYRYFADKLNCSSGDLSLADLKQVMNQHNIRPSTVKQIMTCLELAEGSRYAPVSEEDTTALLSQTFQALTALDRQWNAR